MATRAWLSFYDQAKQEISAEIFNTFLKVNKEKPLISDFYKYNHLQKLEKQIQATVIKIGKREEIYTGKVLKQGVRIGNKAVDNVLKTGALNQRAIDQIIKYPWSGANFSDRIWNNKGQLITQLKDKLTNGIIQGRSIYQISSDVQDRLDVGRSQTQRLVRTEYMHALNQGQVETYKAKGYTKLRWVAKMDDKTSDICRKRNGKEYLISELPDIPAHPNCRCTLVPVISQEDIDRMAGELKSAKKDLINAKENAPKISKFAVPTESIMKKLSDESNAWMKKITNSEFRAIDNFTDTWFNDMNGLLMDSEYSSVDDDYVYFNIDNLTKALNKFSLKEDISVFRGVSLDEYNQILANKNGVFKEFKSTTTSSDIAERFALKNEGKTIKFNVPKGSSGAYVGDNTASAGEFEFIINRGSKYEAKEVDGVLEVTILENEPKELPEYDFDDD